MSQKQYIIDGNRFHDRMTVRTEFWAVLTKDFLKGEAKDRVKTINLDAFNDILFGGLGTFDSPEPIQLIWKRSQKSRVELGYDETVLYLREKLQWCHPTNRAAVEAEIAAAEAHTGPTLFDLIITIIQKQEHITLTLE